MKYLVWAAAVWLALSPLAAMAAGKTAWVAGNGQGLTYGIAFNATDFTGAQPTNNQSLLSTITITNGTALDQFMDVSVVQSIASSTVAAGAAFNIYVIPLAADGSTYTPALTAGTAASVTLPGPIACPILLYAAATQTTLTGTCTGIVIPPGSFKIAMQNLSGFTLTAGTQVWDYRTYNINVNN